MNAWPPRILIALMLLAIVGLPVVWRPAREQAAANALKLVIVTPHNEQIRYETAHAFSDWHERRFGQPVIIDWRTPGGTSDIRRILFSQYEAALRQSIQTGRPLADIGYDLAFGGGDYEYDKYYRRTGVTVEATGPGGQSVKRTIPITQPITFTKEELDVAAVYGDGRIADNTLFDLSQVADTPAGENPPAHWYGVVLSSFGIVYNRDVLAMRGLPEPREWSDLAAPRYAGWVALGDPRHSGAVRVTYDTIVRRYGYAKGFATLRRVFANARYFATSGSLVPVDVSAGDAAAGMCIDFYGRLQAEAVGNDRVGYISPVGASFYSCDPIAVLNGVRDRDGDARLTLAKRFIQFQLTREGQAVWCMPPRRSSDAAAADELGPIRYALRRPPVRRDMYEPATFDRMIDRVNYYAQAVPMPADSPSYMGVVNEMLSAMAMDVHADLKAAWSAINRLEREVQRHDVADEVLSPAQQRQLEADRKRLNDMKALFDAMPFKSRDDLFAAAARWRTHPETHHHDRLAWTAFFRDNYAKVVERGRSE
jgi:iron(III) transport system substrate-binding protein